MSIPVIIPGTKGVGWGPAHWLRGSEVLYNGECWTATQEKGQGCGTDGFLLSDLSQLSSRSGVLATGISVCLSQEQRSELWGRECVPICRKSPWRCGPSCFPAGFHFSDVPRLLLCLISVCSGVLGACFLFTTERLEGRHLTLLGSLSPGKGRVFSRYRTKQWVFFTALCGKQ